MGTFGEHGEAFDEGGRGVFHVTEDLSHRVPTIVDFAFRLAVFHFDRDHIGIAKKIVQASERFLIGTDQKDPEQVVIVFAQFVHGQHLVAFLAGEVFQHAIAVAGQIADDGFPGGRFVEPVHGHDWKQLIDGP